jgi:hypothetical protein
MDRQMFPGGEGFTFGRTELRELVCSKDGCHDGVAWADLDGDGCIDLVGVETQNGHADEDHELVGLHVPSGRVVWRALTGEVSRQVSIVNGVVLCATNERTMLRGLDPRTGTALWSIQLPDVLRMNSFDGFEGARSIADRGPLAVFECDDGSVHGVDARTGRIVFQQRGKLAFHTLNVPGLVAVRGDDTFTLFDVFQNRAVYQAPDEDVGMALGAGKVAFFHFDPPEGTHTTVIDLQTRQVVAKASLKKPDGDCPMLNQVCDEPGAGIILDSGRILKGKRFDESLTILDVARRQVVIQPPPKPGFVFWQMVRVGNVLFVAYKQEEGTPRIVLSAWDANTLASFGVLEGFGGYDVPNAVLPTTTGLLVAKAQLKDGTWKRNNPVAWWHLDPATGQKITEYPVPELGCVEVHGKFLCASGTTYGGCHPVVYDTERRARVL